MRIIAKLETKTGWLIKGRQLEGIRKVGDPAEFAKKYYLEGADEIAFFDSVASLYGRNTLHDVIEQVSKNIFIPFSVGGGLKNINDCKKMFNLGADKIHINTALFENIELIDEVSKKFGAQALNIEIQVKKDTEGYFCYCQFGREYTKWKLDMWINEINKYNWGELIVTAIHKDGLNKGTDMELIKLLRDLIPDKPFVYSGGYSPKHDDLNELRMYLDGLMIASAFHFESAAPNELSQRKQ